MQSFGMASVVVDKLLTLRVENASPPTPYASRPCIVFTQCLDRICTRHKSFILISRGMWLMMCFVNHDCVVR